MSKDGKDDKKKEVNLDDSLSDIDDSDSDDETVERVKVTKEFQEYVVKFVKLDDLIRKKNEELTELKKQKKPCEEFILKQLDKMNENVIEITDGKLRKNKSESKASLNQDIITNALKEKIKDPQQVSDIMALMESMRPTTTHTNIKRTSVRKQKPIKSVKK